MRLLHILKKKTEIVNFVLCDVPDGFYHGILYFKKCSVSS